MEGLNIKGEKIMKNSHWRRRSRIKTSEKSSEFARTIENSMNEIFRNKRFSETTQRRWRASDYTNHPCSFIENNQE